MASTSKADDYDRRRLSQEEALRVNEYTARGGEWTAVQVSDILRRGE
jgi:hypothetical protein